MLTPVPPMIGHPVIKRGKPTSELCGVCHEPMRVGQLHAGVHHSTAPPLSDEGVRLTDEGYFEGHYLCVCDALGPAEVLLAVQQERLAMVNPALLDDGCLPKEHGGV